MVTRRDAFAYLKLVKNSLNSENYAEFIKIMADFKTSRVDTHGVIQRAENLFDGRSDLIQGFNKFLPDGCEIAEKKGKKKHIEFSDALRYVNKVKARFKGGSTYKSFLKILNVHKSQPQISPADPRGHNEVYKQVSELFGAEHRDLVEEFTRFSPMMSRMPGRAVDDLSRRLSRL